MKYLKKWLNTVFVTSLLVVANGAYAETSLEENLQRATITGKVLHDTWYNQNNGQWVGTYKGLNDYWWHSANSLTGLLMLMEASDYSISYEISMENTYTKGNLTAGGFMSYYNDDMMWWGLAWLKAYQVLQQVNPAYENIDKVRDVPINIFNNVITSQWDNTFGGGVWWSKARDGSEYKNSITNGLFLVLATELAEEFPDNPTYLSWAQKSWNWYKSSGLINDQYLINDGLNNSTGANNGGITWTYNQGMVIGGLVGLYKLTGEADYLTEAQMLANATLTYLADTDLNVLRDLCEPNNGCQPNPNSGQFKGIFMRYFVDLIEVTTDPELRSTYTQFVLDSADSTWNKNRNASNEFGHEWTGIYKWNDPIYDPIFQSSALDLFNAAVRVQKI